MNATRIGRRNLLLAAAALPLAIATIDHAQAQQRQPAPVRVESISIQEFGRYERGPADSMQLVERTQRIPARVGVAFGFSYVVEGPAAALPAELNFVIRLPQRGGMLDPAVGRPVFTLEERVSARIGATNITGYIMDREWKVVPGRWNLEIWAGGRKLGEKSFELVRP